MKLESVCELNRKVGGRREDARKKSKNKHEPRLGEWQVSSQTTINMHMIPKNPPPVVTVISQS